MHQLFDEPRGPCCVHDSIERSLIFQITQCTFRQSALFCWQVPCGVPLWPESLDFAVMRRLSCFFACCFASITRSDKSGRSSGWPEIFPDHNRPWDQCGWIHRKGAAKAEVAEGFRDNVEITVAFEVTQGE